MFRVIEKVLYWLNAAKTVAPAVEVAPARVDIRYNVVRLGARLQ